MLVSGLEDVAFTISTYLPGEDGHFLPQERPKVTLLPIFITWRIPAREAAVPTNAFSKQLGRQTHTQSWRTR